MKRTFKLFVLLAAVLLVAGCVAAPELKLGSDSTCMDCSVTADLKPVLEVTYGNPTVYRQSGVTNGYSYSSTLQVEDLGGGLTQIESSSVWSKNLPEPTVEVIRVNPATGEDTIPVEEGEDTVRINPAPNGLNAVNSVNAQIDPQYSQEAVAALEQVYLLGEGFQVLLQSGPQKNFVINNSVGEIHCGKMSVAYANCGNEALGYNVFLFLKSAEMQYNEEVSLKINGVSFTGYTFQVDPGDVITEFQLGFRLMQRR